MRKAQQQENRKNEKARGEAATTEALEGENMATKKDYEVTAAIIRDIIADATAAELSPFREGVVFAARDIAERMARLYSEDNVKFDETRFFKACGLEAV